MQLISKQKYQLLASLEENEDNSKTKEERTSETKKILINEQQCEDLELKTTSTRHFKSLCGLLCAFASCCFFATGSVFTKLCNGSLNALQIVLIRSLVQLLFCIPTITFYRLHIWQEFTPTTRSLLILRGIFGGSALILIFYSFQNLPLGDASAIIFSASVYTLLLARICLKEKFICLDVLVLTATIVGVIFIAQPSALFSTQTDRTANLSPNNTYSTVVTSNASKTLQTHNSNLVLGLIAAVSASLLVSCSHIVLRKLPTVHYTIPLFYLSVTGVIATSLSLTNQRTFLLPSNAKYWGYALFVGICGFAGQAFMTKAYQMEKAGPVAIVRQCDIVFAYIFQVIVFDDPLQTLSCIGAVLVVVGVFTLAIKKLASSTESMQTRKKSCFCKEI